MNENSLHLTSQILGVQDTMNCEHTIAVPKGAEPLCSTQGKRVPSKNASRIFIMDIL